MTRLDLRLGGMSVCRMLAFALAATAFATLLGGCAEDALISRFQLKPDDVIIERRPDTAYENLVPYYVELCAASQFRSKLTGEGSVFCSLRRRRFRIPAARERSVADNFL